MQPQTDKERMRDTETGSQREKSRHSQTDIDRERQRKIESYRNRDKESQTQKKTDPEKQTDSQVRQTDDRESERQRQTETHRECRHQTDKVRCSDKQFSRQRMYTDIQTEMITVARVFSICCLHAMDRCNLCRGTLRILSRGFRMTSTSGTCNQSSPAVNQFSQSFNQTIYIAPPLYAEAPQAYRLRY